MCYRPNVLFYRENSVIRKDNQKGIQRITIIFPNDPKFKGYEYYIEENKRLQNKKEYGEKFGYKLIPCGKCLACKKQQRMQWALRVELEAKQYENNYFLTLTYDENNIKIPDYTINKITGEKFENDGSWVGTLDKKDLQLFLKSTRKFFERDYNMDGMKFYACGEYGDIGNRPHYHIIMMNTPNLDLKLIGQNNKGIYHTNERLKQIWHKGFITIEPTNWDTISYTTGYCEKKLFGEIKEELHARQGQEPIFAQMSRRPGIGRTYFEKNKENIYECDEIINSKGDKIRPPSYFDRLMDAGEKDFMDSLKEKRQENQLNKLKLKMSKTDLTIQEQLKLEESIAKDKDKQYRRRYKTI